ncbi:hypothetical protein NQ317_014841 [Molorchus minor]|uniref:Uncharacterized protein n=1 Tax=Molorchus minor TaxID=1323400 RepID=A0ABQ9JU18_9CUCU|nr:hypothetical protein NQ317_014841 [Molorchus minor]
METPFKIIKTDSGEYVLSQWKKSCLNVAIKYNCNVQKLHNVKTAVKNVTERCLVVIFVFKDARNLTLMSELSRNTKTLIFSRSKPQRSTIAKVLPIPCKEVLKCQHHCRVHAEYVSKDGCTNDAQSGAESSWSAITSAPYRAERHVNPVSVIAPTGVFTARARKNVGTSASNVRKSALGGAYTNLARTSVETSVMSDRVRNPAQNDLSAATLASVSVTTRVQRNVGSAIKTR